VLINNLGATPVIELYLMAKYITDSLTQNWGLNVVRILTGHFMTSLDMQGVSATLLRVGSDESEFILDCLDCETSAPAWPKGVHIPNAQMEVQVDEKNDHKNEIVELTEQDRYLAGAIQSACHTILRHRIYLNELDQKVKRSFFFITNYHHNLF
jgi:hypothetical protein